MLEFRFGFDPPAEVEHAFAQLIHQPWGASADRWRPKVDVFETEDAYWVQVDVPGVPPEAIAVRTEAACLIIEGERSATRLAAAGRAVRLERTGGTFSRRIPLEHPIDLDRMERQEDRGILNIYIPKRDAPSSSTAVASVPSS